MEGSSKITDGGDKRTERERAKMTKDVAASGFANASAERGERSEGAHERGGKEKKHTVSDGNGDDR